MHANSQNNQKVKEFKIANKVQQSLAFGCLIILLEAWKRLSQQYYRYLCINRLCCKWIFIIQTGSSKMTIMAQQLKKKIHIRNTDYFVKNYKPFLEDVDKGRIKDIIDVELQCLGYGIFNPKKLLENFTDYTLQMFRAARTVSTIKSLKIILNGFALDQTNPILQRIAKQIPSIKDNIHTLWIHTSNLSNVTLKDFNELLRLSHTLSDINFQNFSLQCANWTFTPNQPTFSELRKIFETLIKESADITKIMNKNFRLEMSGWYYTLADANAFLGFKLDEKQLKKVPQKLRSQYKDGAEYSDQAFYKQLQKFFVGMETLVKQLLVVMDNIEQLQLDMRNTHEVLKMKNLKKRLDNITKDNRTQKSIMSKRMDVQADSEDKQLRLNIVM